MSAALERLRPEVRSAREVVSPNVCRVFDLVEVEGRECVSMEYVDGMTLRRRPGDPEPARLRGGAGDRAPAPRRAGGDPRGRARPPRHQARERDAHPGGARGGDGLRHRQGGAERGRDGGRHAGVHGAGAGARRAARPASRRLRGGHRAGGDGRALGRARPRGAARRSGQAVHRGARREVADTPWARGRSARRSRRARSERYPAPQALARALEEVTLRVAGARRRSPYPGLASFTEADAEYFFGREPRSRRCGSKLRRPHLLALVGPSGAGKSSFLRPGSGPRRPQGWRAVDRHARAIGPFVALAQALVPELSGDTERRRAAAALRGAGRRGAACRRAGAPPRPGARWSSTSSRSSSP